MKVSIITIVYNNQENIVNCIRSVLQQSYSDIEYILIDGASMDGTQNKIQPFIDEIDYYISEKDNGLYAALNKGIKKANGDIIGILHSDDEFYSSDTIRNMVDAFKESKADLIYANGMYVDKYNINIVKRIYKAKPFKKHFLDFGWIPLHTTIFVRKNVFAKYGFYNESYKIASDYEISLRWFKNERLTKHFIDKWVVKMRLGGKSTLIGLQKEKSIEDLEIIRQYELKGILTLAFKIGRKIPQYILPKFVKY